MPKPAARLRLTDRAVAALRAEGKRRTVFDGVVPGFAVRITERGVKSYVVVTRHRGRQRWITLGGVGVLGLAEARERAREALTRARRGEDPVPPKAEVRPTFAGVAARFVAEYAQPRNRSWRETERILRVYCARWANRDIGSLTRSDVRDLLDSVATDRGPIMANRTLAAVRRLFSWCLERDIVAASPAAGVKPPARETSRDRVLTDAELATFWAAAGALPPPWGAFFRMLALTGQRLSEVARMRWQDLDLERALWTLPRELTKADRLHEVPLSPPALDILQGLPRFSGPFVFTTGDGTTPISGFRSPKAALDQAIGASQARRWTNHDLRRTFATVSARLGTPPHVVEKVLNHSSGSIRGVAAVYNRYGYDAEKRECLDAWAQHLLGLPERLTHDDVT